jgi:sensor domain CHASE-containing protein/anti-sigma regulatory factor (Ser/Thr protein kinase)
MKILTKSLLIAGICVALLISFLVVYTAFVFVGTFSNFEKQDEQKKAEVTLTVLGNEMSGLQKIAYDWGPWDDTYQFIQDNNTEYAEKNLNQETLKNLNIDYMLFFSQNSSLVYVAGYDPESGDPVPLKPDVHDVITRNWAAISEGNGTSGVITTGPESYFLASSQIVQSDFGGERRGTMVLIRQITGDQVALMRELTGLTLDIVPLGSRQVPAEVLGKGVKALSVPVDDQVITTYVNVPGIDGENAFRFIITSSRSIYNSGLFSIYLFVSGLIVTAIACLALMMYLLRMKIFRRLAELSTKMEEIGASRNFQLRVDDSGDDEISHLAGSCNSMIGALDTAAGDLKRAYERTRLYLDVLLYDINNNAMAINGFASLLENSSKEESREIISQIKKVINDCTGTIGAVETYENLSRRTPVLGPVSVDRIFELSMSGFARSRVKAAMTGLYVEADDLLSVLVSHLIRNSFEAGGDTVEVSLSAREIPGGEVEISVEDTGPGIPDTMKEAIFQRFSDQGSFRVSNGLGLKIARILMDSYGGSIRAEDRVPGSQGIGAAIRLCLVQAHPDIPTKGKKD